MTIYSKRYELPILPPDRAEKNPLPGEAERVIKKLYRELSYRYMPERKEKIKEMLEEIKSFTELREIDIDICRTEIDIQARLYFRYLFGWTGSLKDDLIALLDECDEIKIETDKNGEYDYILVLIIATHATYRGNRRTFPPE